MASQNPIPDFGSLIDLQDALGRLCGNRALYKSLLETFRSGNPYEQLRKEAAEGNLEAAAKTAHGMKGVAANLSLKALYEQALLVEGQLKAGDSSEQGMDDLGGILGETLEAVERAIATL